MDEASRATLDTQDIKDPGYEIFIILVSILSVIDLIISWLPGIDTDAINIIVTFNFFLTIIFISYFRYRFFTAVSKKYYFFRDWEEADLLANISALRILRLFRIFKTYHLLDKYCGRSIFYPLKKHRAERVLYIVIFCVMLVIEARVFLSSRPNAPPRMPYPVGLRCHMGGVRDDNPRRRWRPLPCHQCRENSRGSWS